MKGTSQEPPKLLFQVRVLVGLPNVPEAQLEEQSASTRPGVGSNPTGDANLCLENKDVEE